MIKIGINGLGRIGKCCLLQLINNNKYQICCVNVVNVKITELEDYLKHDTIHFYDKHFNFEILSEDTFQINNHTVKLVSDRNAKNINWREHGCEYLIDATGQYLTKEKCRDHQVDHVVMSSPAKDDTPTFIYGVNHDSYRGESVVSGSSCTTNCLAPMLRLLNSTFGIKTSVFTTIHAVTASQYTVDIANTTLRTSRSILNNIIPHTTGATSSVTSVLPELKNKIHGTSIRVPVLNCSLLDLNVELKDETVTLNEVKQLIKKNELFKIVYDVNEKNLVSCDFLTTSTPTILDFKASIDMGNGKMKLMMWYDNEWSYSAQLIRLVDSMFTMNHQVKASKYYIQNMDISGKSVVCRFDFNVPKDNDGNVTDDFRISSSISTIRSILSKNPKYLVLVSHFGRPKSRDTLNSLRFVVPILEKYLNLKVKFLENGVSRETIQEISNDPTGIYLLENIRFHREEMDYETMDNAEAESNQIVSLYKTLGDIFICDAFGCLHRKHMSICAFQNFNKPYGYGNLIKKEIDNIDMIINNNGKKILSIIGGNKIKDKLPIINSLQTIQNSTIFIAGGLAKQYKENYSNVIVMNDGYGAKSLNDEPEYISNIHDENNVYDIGPKSFEILVRKIKESDIIFWNGSLGVIEHPVYKKGSVELIQMLGLLENKTIIIGGGETASLVEDKTGAIYISTGGGALLEYLQNKIINGKNLVGLDIFT